MVYFFGFVTLICIIKMISLLDYHNFFSLTRDLYKKLCREIIHTNTQSNQIQRIDQAIQEITESMFSQEQNITTGTYYITGGYQPTTQLNSFFEKKKEMYYIKIPVYFEGESL